MDKFEASKSAVYDAMLEGFELFKKKNRDYGNSFFEEDGNNAFQEIKRKFARLKNIYENKLDGELCVDETLQDTLRDLGNYCFMEIARLKLKESE